MSFLGLGYVVTAATGTFDLNTMAPSSSSGIPDILQASCRIYRGNSERVLLTVTSVEAGAGADPGLPCDLKVLVNDTLAVDGSMVEYVVSGSSAYVAPGRSSRTFVLSNVSFIDLRLEHPYARIRGAYSLNVLV
jgi:hypothetical protein